MGSKMAKGKRVVAKRRAAPGTGKASKAARAPSKKEVSRVLKKGGGEGRGKTPVKAVSEAISKARTKAGAASKKAAPRTATKRKTAGTARGKAVGASAGKTSGRPRAAAKKVRGTVTRSRAGKTARPKTRGRAVTGKAAGRAKPVSDEEAAFRQYAGRLPQKTVIELLESSRKVMGDWGRKGMPRNADAGRTYDLWKVLPWLKRWLLHRYDDDELMTGPGGPETEWQRRYRRAKALREEIALKVQAGDLVQRKDVERQWGVVLTDLKTRLSGLPNALAQRLAGRPAKEVAPLLRAAVKELMEEMAAAYRGSD